MTTEAELQTLGEFAHQGFTLQHTDNHILFLLHDGRFIASFQPAATPEVIQEECMNHLVMKHGWDGCVWSRKEAK